MSPVLAWSQLTYSLVSDASYIPLTNHCFELTPSISFQKGAVWYHNPIDLTQDFTLDFHAYFGTRDANGSDGIALVFKTDSSPQIGGKGGAIGYSGISPSVAIEFDDLDNTLWSPGFGDIAADHIAVQRDGISDHSIGWANLGGPTQASATSPNIEDGNWHNVRVEYTATTEQLFIYFDCNLRINVATFPLPTFLGQNEAYFGFTASTGGATHYNLQRVCLNYLSNANIALQDTTICNGSSVAVDGTVASGVTYSWSPTTGVSNPNIANPSLSPTATTNYQLSITDACGNTDVHEMLVTVSALPTAQVLQDSTICVGSAIQVDGTVPNGLTYSWWPNTGVSNPNIANPSLSPTTTTNYQLSITDTCGNTDVYEMLVTVLPFPTVNAGPDVQICAGEVLNIDATATNGNALIWQSFGDGTFSNQTIEDPIYTPGPNDISSGSAFLLVVNSNGTCGSSSFLLLSINPTSVPPAIIHD